MARWLRYPKSARLITSSSAASTGGAAPKSISATNAPITPGPPFVHFWLPRARSSSSVVRLAISANVSMVSSTL
jgi:hypothetical protein